MKTSTFLKKLQTYKVNNNKVVIQYKPYKKNMWCTYGSRYPNYHYIPIIVREFCDKNCIIKLSSTEDENDFIIVTHLHHR